MRLYINAIAKTAHITKIITTHTIGSVVLMNSLVEIRSDELGVAAVLEGSVAMETESVQ